MKYRNKTFFFLDTTGKKLAVCQSLGQVWGGAEIIEVNTVMIPKVDNKCGCACWFGLLLSADTPNLPFRMAR